MQDYLTALHVAAHYGNVAVAKLLLDCKCQVDACALVSEIQLSGDSSLEYMLLELFYFFISVQ